MTRARRRAPNPNAEAAFAPRAGTPAKVRSERSSLCLARMQAVQRLTPDRQFNVNWEGSRIEHFLQDFAVDTDPDYQRGYVWTPDQKRAFVGALIQAPERIPPLWFNFVGPGDSRSEVVDGKQRIEAVRGWVRGEYEAFCPCGEVFWAADMDGDNYHLMMKLTMNFVRLPRAEVLRFYLDLNTGGTVHAPEDLDRVRGLLAQEGEP